MGKKNRPIEGDWIVDDRDIGDTNFSRPIMVVMIGIHGSGKSTFCELYFGGSKWTRINLDTLHTRNKEERAIKTAISARQNIVIDNTNLTMEERKKYIDMAVSAGYKVDGVLMQSVLKDCILRNELREGKDCIPNKDIACTSNKLEMPSFGERFSDIAFVKIEEGRFVVEKWRNA